MSAGVSEVKEGLKTGCKAPAEACYLKHVCIAVMGVLHHHRLGSRQSVRDAVLVFVAYGLVGTEGKERKKERRDQYIEEDL